MRLLKSTLDVLIDYILIVSKWLALRQVEMDLRTLPVKLQRKKVQQNTHLGVQISRHQHL